MAIPDNVLKQVWERAGGQCECEKRTHSHFYVPCAKPLVWENRGKKGWGGWEIKHIDVNKGDVASNLEVVCITCFEAQV
ncbi:MAG: hypothetical protein JW967_00200 [Dehalococcoidales bacterium]|nr:hypothetical protein [Dehalococcoidales bacterium]